MFSEVSAIEGLQHAFPQRPTKASKMAADQPNHLTFVIRCINDSYFLPDWIMGISSNAFLNVN